MSYLKDFIGWHGVKLSVDSLGHGPTFQEREVWWCSIGVNVGHEVDGKGAIYNRPVLVLRKFNNHLFWGVPLSTQIKENPYYFRINFIKKDQCVLLTHLRLYDGRRLTHKMGQMPRKSFDEVCEAIRKLL